MQELVPAPWGGIIRTQVLSKRRASLRAVNFISGGKYQPSTRQLGCEECQQYSVPNGVRRKVCLFHLIYSFHTTVHTRAAIT